MRYSVLHIILPVMFGLACAASCTSDPLNAEKGEELRFEVEDCSTRATTVTTTSNLTGQPFRLFGDVYRNGEFHSGLRTIFENAKVTYKNKQWDYGAKQYWHMGQEHSFVAIHPYEIQGMSDIKYEGSKVSFTYEMPEEGPDEILDENSSKIKDIVVATHRRKYNLDNDKSGPVKFKFEHLLTRINIAPALQDSLMYVKDDETKKDIEFGYDLIRNEYIQIRKVELIGFYTKADYSITPKPLGSSTQTDDRELSWEIDKSSSKTISFYIPEAGSPHIFNDGVNVSVLNDNAAIMMIPQEFADNAQIKLEYSVNTDNTEPTELRSVIVPLKNKTLERGKSYTMKFTIKKVYKGQIKESSIKWEVTDIPASDAGQNWINDTGTISQDFGDKDKGDDNQSNSENNNDNEE